MKTTVEIPDSLLKEAKKLASAEGTTMRALLEEGLRRILDDRKQNGAFRLRKVTFKGEGLQHHIAGSSWDRVRDIICEERGG
jgi:hypothetical protein